MENNKKLSDNLIKGKEYIWHSTWTNTDRKAVYLGKKEIKSVIWDLFRIDDEKDGCHFFSPVEVNDHFREV